MIRSLIIVSCLVIISFEDIDAQNLASHSIVTLDEEWMMYRTRGEWNDAMSPDKIEPYARWQPHRFNESLFGKKNDIVWLKKQLPRLGMNHPVLFIERFLIYVPFRVYCDHQLIYQYGGKNTPQHNKHLYMHWHFIALPETCSGQTIYLRLYFDRWHFTAIHEAPIGEPNILFQKKILSDLPRTIIAFLFILIGIIGYCFFVARIYIRDNLVVFIFGNISFFSGLYILAAESHITQLYFDYPVILSFARYFTSFVFIGSIWAFVEFVPGMKLGKMFRILWLYYWSCAASMLAFPITPKRYYDILLESSWLVSIIACFIAEICFVFYAIKGNRKTKILAAGLGIYASIGIIDMIGAIFLIYQNYLFYPLGLSAFLASLVYFLIDRYQDEQRMAQLQLRESEEKYRNLFENAPIGIFEADLTESPPMIHYGNAEAWKIAGNERILAQRMRLDDIISIELIQQMQKALTTGSEYTVETVYCPTFGEKVPIRLRSSFLIAFRLNKVIISMEDITDEKNRQSEEKAVSEERRRIAREIHDGLAQDLAFIRFRTGKWRRIVEKNPVEMHKEIDHLREVLDKNIQDVRRSIFALRPVALEELGFFPALERFINDLKEFSQLHVELTISGNQNQLSQSMEPVLFRILQETLNNIVKHASTDSAWVEIHILSEEIRLIVSDNGVGFDSLKLDEMIKQGHIGLKQIRERVESLNGQCTIVSEKGQGVTIQITLPQ